MWPVSFLPHPCRSQSWRHSLSLMSSDSKRRRVVYLDKKSFCSCGIPEDDVRLWITSYSTTCKYTNTNTQICGRWWPLTSQRRTGCWCGLLQSVTKLRLHRWACVLILCGAGASYFFTRSIWDGFKKPRHITFPLLYLSKVYLSKVYLSKVYLSKVFLSEVYLSNVYLSKVYLSNVYLSKVCS